MPVSPNVVWRRWLNVLVGLALLAAALPLGRAQPARAEAAELFFSEYIEGSSNNKALEIFNDTGAAIDLGAGGYNIQMYFNGSASAGLTIGLTGTVADGDVFVIAQSSASAVILAQADQTNSSGWYNGDDAVVLRKGAAIVDAIGQIGVDPGSEWGSGLTSTADNTLRRKATVSAGDIDGTNAFDPSLEWDGLATDTFDGLGSHGVAGPDQAPTVAVTPPDGGQLHVGGNLSLVFSEPVNVSGTWLSLTCSASGTVAGAISGGPTSFIFDPQSDLVNGEACTLTVLAAGVTDQDANDPPDNLAVDFTVGFTAVDYCAQTFTPAYAIQGSGDTAATTGIVTTQGVVVGDFEGSASQQGFYLQDAAGDGDAATSDGLFVFTGSADTVTAGQVVRVTGYARERFNQTTLNGANSNGAAVPASNIVACGTGAVTPTDVMLPFASATAPERYEGMLVRLPQALVISEYFNYDRFGELVLALPLEGETRAFTPTAIDEPGPAAQARALANNLRRITLDDAVSTQNPSTVRHPNGLPFSLTNRFRGGDTVANTVGVLGFDFSLYRIFPTAPADYAAVNPRPAAPEPVGGSLRVGAMNMLNYFVTADYPTGSQLDNKCGPGQNLECRGWDSDQPDELQRQRAKLVAAVAGLEADIVGLNELENTSGVDPLGDATHGLITGLNAMLGAGTYAAIDTGVIGTDAIKVGLIYKPARVRPVGSFALLTTAADPRFLDDKNRPVLAQTFEDLTTGARFTVAVNHLKSKGSACSDVGDPDTGDGQGNCNLTRQAAAQALVDWLAADPTGSGDPDFLIIGDLNSYAMEDPIDAVRLGADDAAGTFDDYRNLIAHYQGAYAYSYVFDGQAGYLDHALANTSLARQATGAADWHINADEPDLLDYDTTFKPPAQDALYEPNAYRSSDHDPLVVGLELFTPYAFSGFFAPVQNPPAVNQARAGQSVPFKFSLGGDRGLAIVLSATSRELACGGGQPSPTEPTSGPGSAGLTYDAATGQYTYLWKTEKDWAGTCRQFTLVLDDGTEHRALFQFVR